MSAVELGSCARTKGFGNDFWEVQNLLSLRNVLEGKTAPSLSVNKGNIGFRAKVDF